MPVDPAARHAEPLLLVGYEELLEARRDVLKQAVEIFNASFRQGTTSINAVIAANVALLEAKLEMAGSKVERLLVLEQLLKQHKELEQQTAEMFKAAVGSRQDYPAAKAARLKVEIELHKARKVAEARNNGGVFGVPQLVAVFL